MAVVIGGAPVVLAACGDDTQQVSDTLPPIATTTTTTMLAITTTTIPLVYEVQPGDILTVIADRFGVTMEDIMALNGIDNPDHIEVGQKLKIPQPGQVIPTTTTAVPETTAGG